MAVFIRYTDETSLRCRPGDVPRAPAGGRKGWLCGIPAALGAGVAALLRRTAAGYRREIDPIARAVAAAVQVDTVGVRNMALGGTLSGLAGLTIIDRVSRGSVPFKVVRN